MNTDGTDGVQSLDGVIDGFAADHDCGPDGAVGSVVAFYDNDASVGVIIEGQRDNLPDADSDTAVFNAIVASLTWD